MINFLQTVQSRGLILDGAMSTALEKLGVTTNNELWTANALIHNLQQVYQVHYQYFQAGAQLAITDTYQANLSAFERVGYSQDQAVTFIRSAVQTAQQARDDFYDQTGHYNFVSGTIGPYGAYLADGSEYRGDYQLSRSEFLAFHLPRLQAIIQERPDCIGIETQPQWLEVKTLLDWLQCHAPQMPVYVSFTLQDAHTLSSGTPLQAVIPLLNQNPQVFAVGCNCCAPQLVLPAIQTLTALTNKDIIVYPNLGSQYDPVIKKWQPIMPPVDFAQLVPQWYQAGAHLIGGCCTTYLPEIQKITHYFESLGSVS